MNYSLVWNTVKYLKPVQVVYQMRNRFKKKKRVYFETLPVGYRKAKIAIPELDCNGVLEERFKPEEIAKGRVFLLNQVVELNYNPSYTKTLKPLIYNNIYYFEYGIALAAKFQKTKDKIYWELFKKCYDDYLKAHAEVKSAYTMALHIPNVLITLELFGKEVDDVFRERVYCELYSQYLYLQKHQEKHLLANHYFEDLKTLIIASYLFKDDKKLKGYLKDFKRQCEEQILADGVHYELSLMYHKLILEDLMRIGMLSKDSNFPSCEWIISTIKKMTDACHSMEYGIGRTPLFNDSGDNVAKTCTQLCTAAQKYFNINPELKESLPASGYYKLYDRGMALMFDVGCIGVDFQPGHGHCDALSFEMSIGGIPLFVNSGTYEYQGNLRQYFRRTCAHNTIMIGNHEQSECWGGFRVARRIRNLSAERFEKTLKGKYSNFCNEEHTREITLQDGILKVADKVKTKSGVFVKSFLHLAPGFELRSDEIIRKEDQKLIAKIEKNGSSLKIEKDLCLYAPEFGKMLQNICLQFSWDADDNFHGYTIDFNI